ncbi:MAG: thrombospondin type 3 repeat-containing protein [Planctomycetes bacterium]|nr:thrombospondin type 3 repeat-containing protein [Planctomycetota bacterium]
MKRRWCLIYSIFFILPAAELRPQEYVEKIQFHPKVASRQDGFFVLAWSDRSHIYAQKHTVQGGKVGAQITVDDKIPTLDAPNPDVGRPDIDMDRNGNFVVCWDSNNEIYEIHFRLFDGQGKAVKSFTHSDQVQQPSVSLYSDGSFLLAWQGLVNGGVFAQKFDARGLPLGNAFPAKLSPGPGITPDVAASENGAAAIVWRTSNDRLEGVLVDPALALKPLQFNTRDVKDSAVAMAPDGAFAVVWETNPPTPGGGRWVWAQVFKGDGSLLRPAFEVNAGQLYFDPDPDVAAGPDGGFLAVYTSSVTVPAGDLTRIFSKRFHPTAPVADEALAVSAIPGSAFEDRNPAAAMAPNGTVIAAWETFIRDPQGVFLNSENHFRVFNSTTDGDLDSVPNASDNCPEAYNPSQANLDGDVSGDACDGDLDGDGTANDQDACPRDKEDDADGDGICADRDNCPAAANPNQADADKDKLGDACDPCPLDPKDDADGDGRCADADNCPEVANTAQANADGDALGDACDPCPGDVLNDADGDGLCGSVDPCPDDPRNDVDGDGLCADRDNCSQVANPNQNDRDGDGFGDACDPCPDDPANDADRDGLCSNADPCPVDPANDADGDGRCADADNCPEKANPDQQNADQDSLGDACDPCPKDNRNDKDKDGICGDLDNCPSTPNPDQKDTDGDGTGDACERFIRGFVNSDGDLDISDSIGILLFLFVGGDEPPCRDAADADDNGEIEITDAIYGLSFLFLGTAPPESPYPACGRDPTQEGLGCATFAGC